VKRTVTAIVAVLGMCALACGEGRVRAEARAFLTRFELIDHREKPAAREQKLAALEQVALSEPEVVAARKHCLEGHRALLSSERAQEQAAAALDRALAASPGGAPLSGQASEQIRGEIEQAERALARARASLGQCENEARGLRLRFGKP
jgi:hypothetical protein